jgi:ClpP class serine protease
MVALVIVALITIATFLQSIFNEGHAKTTKLYQVNVDADKVLHEIDTTEIEKQTMQQLQKSTQEGAVKIQNAIDGAISRIAEHVEEMTNTTLNAEFQKYQLSLQALREQSITEFTKLQKELDLQRGDMVKQLEKQVVAEHAKRVDQLNSKINDVVSSYVLESLGNNVDLNNQMSFILQKLSEHKQDIKRDILA